MASEQRTKSSFSQLRPVNSAMLSSSVPHVCHSGSRHGSCTSQLLTDGESESPSLGPQPSSTAHLMSPGNFASQLNLRLLQLLEENRLSGDPPQTLNCELVNSPAKDNASPSTFDSPTCSPDHLSPTASSTKRKRSYSVSPITPNSYASDKSIKTDIESPGSSSPGGRVLKRVKTAILSSSHDYEAKEPISFRIAQSLVSSKEPSFVSDMTTSLTETSAASDLDYSSTEEEFTVPIIAPPEFEHIPRAPLTREDAAERRIAILLEKEKVLRNLDGPVHSSGTSTGNSSINWVPEEDFHRGVATWLLNVVPTKKLKLDILTQHLTDHRETHFHALSLFRRYFARVGIAMPMANKDETPLMRLGRRRIVWDIAVSCLALAIKYHRDFLKPLTPIYAHEFIALAPHPMSYDDFEVSQRDVLEAIDYSLCAVTPNAFLQEIYSCLFTLRKVLAFETGWYRAQEYAFERLKLAFIQSDVVKYSISVLTASALIEGVIDALVIKYENELDIKPQEISDRLSSKLENKAQQVTKGLVRDLIDLLVIPEVTLDECRNWLSSLET